MTTGQLSQAPRNGMAGLEVHPLTPDRWDDLVALFGPNGACAGCWCMWWRQSGAEFQRDAGERNREAFKAIVDQGAIPGLLAYRDGRPVGWCSLAPRDEFPRLQRSPVLRPVDDRPVCAVVCFFVKASQRKNGVAAALLRAAVDHAAERGARIVEAYPVDPAGKRISSGSAWTGIASMFGEAGFQEVARRKPSRPIVRYRLS